VPPSASHRTMACSDVEYFMRCAWRQLAWMLVCSGLSSSIPHRELRAVADALAPSATWWRREARAGISELDAYLSRAARAPGR
jgi:hypothetical protein